MDTDSTGSTSGIDLSQRRIVRVDRRHCLHCDRSVSIKTYKAHKRLYFNSSSRNWSVRLRSTNESSQGSSDERSESPCIDYLKWWSTVGITLPVFWSWRYYRLNYGVDLIVFPIIDDWSVCDSDDEGETQLVSFNSIGILFCAIIDCRPTLNLF